MLELAGEPADGPELDLGDSPATRGTDRALDRTSEQVRVFDALSGRSARSVADIGRRAGLPASAVLGALGLLDLEGAVRERETGWVRSS
jgi:DNA processing protein